MRAVNPYRPLLPGAPSPLEIHWRALECHERELEALRDRERHTRRVATWALALAATVVATELVTFVLEVL